MKLKIERIEFKLNRDGERVSGTSKNGKLWSVIRINGIYDCMDFLIKGIKEGDEIDCEIEDGQWGKKITSVLPKEVKVPVDTFKKVVAKIKELEDRLRQVELIIKQ